MNIKSIKHELKKWCLTKEFIKRAWIFGSRIKGSHTEESDLDIAIQIEPFENDTNSCATWFFENEEWKKELQSLFPFEIDLQLYEPGKTENVVKFVDEISVLVYEKSKQSNNLINADGKYVCAKLKSKI